MKPERSMIFAGMLFCLTTLFCQIISPALAGVGCGTNWMGDTSGDTDFWVSKNTNPDSSTPTIAKEGIPIKPSPILGLTPDKPSPQLAGTAITWSARVSDSIEDRTLYDFYLKGPSTNGLQADKTGWTAKNSWTWNTTGVIAGNYQVEVRVKDKDSTKEFDDRKTENYLIEKMTKSDTAVSGESHPESASSGSATTKQEQAADQASKNYDSSTPNMNMPVTKPLSMASETTSNGVRIGSIASAKASATASDSVSASTGGDSQPSSKTEADSYSGVNMNMPDTKPIPLVSASTSDADNQAETATSADTQDDQTSPESDKPSAMDVEGKWTIGLKELGSSMDLILIQSGDTVMGYGTLNDHGNKIPLMVTSGSVAGSSLKLDVKTVVGDYVNQIDKRFNLDMVKVDRQISGSYEAYSGETFDGQGKVTASRFGS